MYDVFVCFKALVENQFKHQIVTFYSDNGGEYKALDQFLSTTGISHLTTPPHTPEHNGFFERRHRHIVETSLSLLTHASMPLTYWTYAFATAVYLVNLMPTPRLHLLAPFETLFGSSPNYSKFLVFGCLCYPRLRPYSQHKLDSRSTPCVFLGYSSIQSAYICLDLSTSKTYISRHVKFLENSFPFLHHQSTLSHPTPGFISKWCLPVQIFPISHGSLNMSPQRDPSCLPPPHHTSPVTPHHLSSIPLSLEPHTSEIPSPSTTTLPTHQNLHHMTTRSKNNIHKPLTKMTLTTALSPSFALEPHTITQALKDPKWRQAMNDEFDALVWNGTW